MARILIIDDDTLFSEMLASVMVLSDHEALSAESMEAGRMLLEQHEFDVVFLDVGLPDGSGLQLLPLIGRVENAPDVIIITGDGDPDGAELAIRNGALDYIQKPASLLSMTQAVERAIAYRKGKQIGPLTPDLAGMIGGSASMRRSFRRMTEAASSDASVLITGETGTGKELFARAIHKNSARADGPFVIVDCAAIAKPLIESELFGYERGAFTGAERSRDGLIMQAHGGTLFLDEVGELPLGQQKAFLRVLQEHRFRPVGGKEERFSDFRLVSATNRDLMGMADRGAFRMDLLFRIQAVRLELPPLRERVGDAPELVRHFVKRTSERYGLAPKSLSPEYLRELSAYYWPGNVRELINVVEQSLMTARNSDTLLPEHLPSAVRAVTTRARVDNALSKQREMQQDAGATVPHSKHHSAAGRPSDQAYPQIPNALAGEYQEYTGVRSGDGTSSGLSVEGRTAPEGHVAEGHGGGEQAFRERVPKTHGIGERGIDERGVGKYAYDDHTVGDPTHDDHANGAQRGESHEAVSGHHGRPPQEAEGSHAPPHYYESNTPYGLHRGGANSHEAPYSGGAVLNNHYQHQGEQAHVPGQAEYNDTAGTVADSGIVSGGAGNPATARTASVPPRGMGGVTTADGTMVGLENEGEWAGDVMQVLRSLEALRVSYENSPAADSGGSVEETEQLLPEWKEFREQAVSAVEQIYLKRLLAVSCGCVTTASRIAGISRQRLYTLFRKHGLTKKWENVN